MKSTGAAALAYLVLSLILTWPLTPGIGRDVPGDLGDSLLNMWILAWGAEHLPRLLTGAISWPAFWEGNIFHPEPLTLALSEHLFGQTLQILPVYWLTGNIILCYNLLFISTFVLSAFGTFLLVRDLTGSARAAFVAGLIYGFLPYRIASVPHLQVLSSQWMPLALFGLNRFLTTGSTKALGGGTAALVMQNWSCGYYLLYFAPFVPLFAIHRMWTLGTLRSVRTWIMLVAAAGVTLALSLPFLFPYREAQELFALERPLGEVIRFSANIWSYVTASENVRLYGDVLRFYLYPEGETFLGIVPWLLAIAAIAAAAVATKPDAGGAGAFDRVRVWRWLLAFVTATQFAALVTVVLSGGFDVDIFGITIRASTPQRLLVQFLGALILLLALSPRMRSRLQQLAPSPVTFMAAATLLAVWLSLGPIPNAGEVRSAGVGLYALLYDYVPGFNGVRVPARFAMIAGLFLSVVAGYGMLRVLRSVSARHQTAVVSVFSAMILIEGAAVPFEINRTWGGGEAVPPARVYPAHARGDGVPPVYGALANLPRGTVITEFPFGDGAWEIRYVYYSTVHFHPITNGYSGGFPPRYKERVARLQRINADPQAAWEALRDSGTTHVVVHRNAFANPENADIVEGWLAARGARAIERFDDGDVVYRTEF